MKNRMNKLAGKMNSMMICAHAALTDRRGEGYVDTAVKILMAVVIGALVLAGPVWRCLAMWSCPP